MKEKINKFWNDHKTTISIAIGLTAVAATTAQTVVQVVKLANELRDDENDEPLEIEGQFSDEDLTQALNDTLDN